MKKIWSILSSTRLMAVLFIVFAIAMGVATFIENDYNTDTARLVVYNSWWFEAIMVIFVINFIGNIKRYQLHKKEKWATLILHLSFILILVGAFITRYISYEGIMIIKEEESSDQIISERAHITAMVDGDLNGEAKRLTFSEPTLFSAALNQDNFVSNFASNHYHLKSSFNKIPFEIKLKEYIMGAEEIIEEDNNGNLFLKLVESVEGSRHEHFIEEGTVEMIHNVLYAFNEPTDGAINFTMKNGEMYINTPFEGNYMIMATQETGEIYKDEQQLLKYRSMYNLQGVQFVTDRPIRGKKVLKAKNDFKDKNSEDAIVLSVITQGKEQEVTLKGGKGHVGIPQSFQLGDLEFTLMYGSKIYTTPFKVQLNQFIAEKFPGTENSFKSFESKVSIIDPDGNFDARIYMNNVLDHKGFRFFQSSFEYSSQESHQLGNPDTTILSVNHDFWGTWITYIGYTLLYIALLAILFTKNTRFNDLKNKLNKIKIKKANLTAVLLLLSTVTFAQHNHGKPTEKQLDSLLNIVRISEEHANEFGKLVIQDDGGRMKPLNTFTSELLRKVAKAESFKGMDGDQVFISMMQYPMIWHNMPMINLKRGNDSLRNILSLPVDAKYASFLDFFDASGNYKLSNVVEQGNKAKIKNQFDKDFIEIDKRVALMSQALSGRIIRIFPLPNDKNNKWISPIELENSGITPSDESYVYIKNIIPLYLQVLEGALQNKDYSKADELLESINTYQHKFGYEIMPTDTHIKYELLYNKYDVFKKLFSWYMYASVLMFVVCIIRIFKDNKLWRVISQVFAITIVILFILHTVGLAVRWYISGHAPWSDAYESMIYVGWATMLFGLIFGRKSDLTLASTAFVASMILMVAHWNYFDPAIGNLQPVLNSYWLMIHVSIIVGSYGPFALGTILGIVSLLLIIFTNKNNKKRMELNIKEITYINEMALTVGLVMLTIGNFLGGQWANESWGRYWGWDPKETWALVSIMIYAFVIHMRFVPALRGTWIYNFLSIIAFYAILMTYFGVNFYLSGLHSYAQGDQMVTPSFIWISVGVVALLGTISYFQYKKYYKK